MPPMVHFGVEIIKQRALKACGLIMPICPLSYKPYWLAH